MKRVLFALVCIVLHTAPAALANDFPIPTRDGLIIHGGAAGTSKAAGDTIALMGPTGSGAAYLGDFEAGWNGWTSVDVTQPTEYHWQISNYNQTDPANLAAWCGDATLASCNDTLDVAGGYGNGWHQQLVFRTAVADPGASAAVRVTGLLQNDTEYGYDYTYLSSRVEGMEGFLEHRAWDGAFTSAVNEYFTYQPSEFIDGTDVVVMFRFRSDGAWSDEDCSFSGAGAFQIDDITVTVEQEGQADIVSYTDFQDGTYGDWAPALPSGVGDFAGLWRNLEDLDPCATNYSQQVAFIDDGLVVPGTGGSDCIDWCYGPYGYVVNTSGGLMGPIGHLQVDVSSPVMNWPDENSDGIIFAFDVYRHEDLAPDSPGVFYTWGVRSADTDNSAGNGIQIIADESYRDRSFVYYGGPDYLRGEWDVTDLMNPGRDEVQVYMGVFEAGWIWGWWGNDATPAPYFDNASVKVYPFVGPGMAARELELAQDNFPEADAIDFGALGTLHVRFDMANNIAGVYDLRNDPGDSLVVDIAAVRAGAVMAGAPELHYIIDANPVFDAYRTTATSGVVQGITAVGVAGPVPDRWAFDLPDSGTLFPGDVLHYYIRAADDLAGDVQWATMPADLTGYGDFGDPLAYNSTFVLHALPSISEDGFGGYDVPDALFWNDFGGRGGQNEWFGAFQRAGLESGVDYDIYYTNAPSSGVGNGVGGRTSGLALERYTDLVYSAGDLAVNTITNGDFNVDPGDDIGALTTWLSAGGKDLFLTGDDVVSDLVYNGGAAGLAFVENVMGLDLVSSDLRPMIGNQAAPLVVPEYGNPVLVNVDRWIAYGGCPGINTFDAVTVRPGAVRLAEFTDPSRFPGAYSFAAATLNQHNTNRVVSFPYDLMSVYTVPGGKIAAPLAAREKLFQDVLLFFGLASEPDVVASVPQPARFSVGNHPNPFNPSTRIDYTVKAPGRLVLKVFSLRGELIRTLVDGEVAGDGYVVWDGCDDKGGPAASGVYCCEARMGEEVRVVKMALLK